jgi:cytochrome c biogenesis protein CcmG/thiol:disulfide interchange protein DsbE
MVQSRATRRRKKRAEVDPRLIIVGALALIAVAIGLMIVTKDDAPSTAASMTDTARASLAPDFTLAGVEDSKITLSDFRGHYVLLNFWATWCPPCQAEMPELQAYYRDYRTQGFILLGVDVQEDAATVSAFLQKNGFDFPVALDMTGMVHAQYGGSALPLSFLIGPNGELIKAWRPGAITRSMLEHDVTPLLGG